MCHRKERRDGATPVSLVPSLVSPFFLLFLSQDPSRPSFTPRFIEATTEARLKGEPERKNIRLTEWRDQKNVSLLSRGKHGPAVPPLDCRPCRPSVVDAVHRSARVALLISRVSSSDILCATRGKINSPLIRFLLKSLQLRPFRREAEDRDAGSRC